MSGVKASPTRITLLAKKRELKTARRGHKLLKDKQDGLMREFLARIREAKQLREELQHVLKESFSLYVCASTLMSPSATKEAFALHCERTYVHAHERQVMSVRIPDFTVTKETTAYPCSTRPYSILGTYGNIESARANVQASLPLIVTLAGVESAVTRLAEEIERTRRRASALEHIRIPQLEAIIRDITLRLEEQNRDAVVNTMRIKALIGS